MPRYHDLRELVRDLSRRYSAGELAGVRVEIEGVQIQDAQFFWQLLADEMAAYKEMPKAQREQEPIKSPRRALAAELWKFAAALDALEARRVVGLET